MGLAAWMGGVDVKKFEEYSKSLPEQPDPEMKKWLEGKLGHPIGKFSSDGTGDMNYPWDDWMGRTANLFGAKFREAVDKGLEAGLAQVPSDRQRRHADQRGQGDDRPEDALHRLDALIHAGWPIRSPRWPGTGR